MTIDEDCARRNQHSAIEVAALHAVDRTQMWSELITALHLECCAELGVLRGSFAAHLLQTCLHIKKYYMIDPWRHLEDWNKPANCPDKEFHAIKAEAMAKTAFAMDKRIVLQGKTTEVSRELPDRGLDFVYVDGDHTLRGITIDLIRLWPKMKTGGILAGDDFCHSVWQHQGDFEPTVVFPFAVHFAEAVGATIYGLPFNQFAIVVEHAGESAFAFHDLTGRYASTSLKDALKRPRKRIVAVIGRRLKRFVFH